MASVGAAAARGIESGIGLGLRLRNQQLGEEEAKRRTQQQDEDRAYLLSERARKTERDADDEAMKALDLQQAALLAEGEGLAARYGDQVPPEIGGEFARKKKEVFGARESLLRKRYEPIIQKRQQAMQDLSTRLQTGQVEVDQVPDVDLYQALVTSTRRPLSDLLSADGKPSRVSTAVTDLMAGIQTDNEGMSLAAANVLAEPELKVGVGQESPHGGTIVAKEIIKLIPHPQNPEEFLPVVRVYVKKGDASTREDGATGYYDAPVTENRSSDPNDPVKSISVKKAMEYAAQLQTLSGMLDRPDLRKKIERGQAEAEKDPEDFLAAFYALKGRMPTSNIEIKSIPAGGAVVGVDKRTGKEVSRIEGPAKTATGLAGNVAAVQAYADENDMSFEEASQLFQERGLLRAPGKGGKGGGKGGGLAGPNIAKGVTGPALLAQLSEEDATIVEGLANGSIKPSEISMKDNRREKMVGLAKRFDPTADFGPNGKMKEMPAKVQQSLMENNTNLQRAQRALRLLGGAPARKGETQDKNATGLKGYLPNQLLNRMDPDGVEARAAIADLGSLIIHERSGAAVTAAEFPRLAPFIPNEKDDAEAVVKKLKRFVEVYREEMDAIQATYGADNGYKPFKLGTGAGGSWDAPPAPAPAPGAAPASPAGLKNLGATPQKAAAPQGARPVTATNPATGEKLILRDGQWQPVQ